MRELKIFEHDVNIIIGRMVNFPYKEVHDLIAFLNQLKMQPEQPQAPNNQ